MISIVICHRNLDCLVKIKGNIEKTIGVPYELQVIDNHDGQYSIFEAYNEGASKSQYPIICFTHEDILFHTENWGQKVMEHFKDKSIGMIGVAGGNVFPKSPSPWWSNNIVNDILINNIQHWKNAYPDTVSQQLISSNPNDVVTKQYNNPAKQGIAEAAVVDGFWFCIRNDLFKNEGIKFDTVTFQGFHNYDCDISLQVKEHARVCVVFDIIVEHFSQGIINKEWIDSTLKLNRKWRSKLPLFAKEIDINKYPVYEWETLKLFIYWASEAGYSNQELAIIISEVAPLLPLDKASKRIFIELSTMVKFGKRISTFVPLFYKLT